MNRYLDWIIAALLVALVAMRFAEWPRTETYDFTPGAPWYSPEQHVRHS